MARVVSTKAAKHDLKETSLGTLESSSDQLLVSDSVYNHGSCHPSPMTHIIRPIPSGKVGPWAGLVGTAHC